MSRLLGTLLGAICLVPAVGPASAEPAAVVAIGASNTSGWGVGEAAAYPARLETYLRQRGLDVRVVNAGIPFETTNGMLGRIDADVPEGTRVVILQPGANDLRFFGTAERRAANVAAMQARLQARGIASILYDPTFAAGDYQWDRIHLTAATHDRIARELVGRVEAVLASRPGRGARKPPATVR